ncbi:hypothetical protein FSC845_00185 [Francisella persica ATCC VR-331]|nr:hypothetical protein FSC845_00185 [Francisella persica ATCC VR-331]
MSKKILIVTSVVKTHIMQFHIPTFQMLKYIGYEVHVCAKNDYEEIFQCQIPFCYKYIKYKLIGHHYLLKISKRIDT